MAEPGSAVRDLAWQRLPPDLRGILPGERGDWDRPAGVYEVQVMPHHHV